MVNPWGLSLDLNLGTGRGIGPAGDPTALTDTYLKSTLGFTVTSSGAKQSHLLETTPGQGFEGVAANTSVFKRTTIAGNAVCGLVVRGAATPLVNYSNNPSNAAWTKTNASAGGLITGGGIGDEDYEIVTFSANNGTVSRTITAASGNNVARVRMTPPSGNTGDIHVSNGAPDTTLLTDDFSSFADLAAVLADPKYSDTSVGTGSVAFDAANDEVDIVRVDSSNYGVFRVLIAGLTIGRFYRVLFTEGAGSAGIRCRWSSAEGTNNGYNAENTRYFQALATSLTLIIEANVAGTGILSSYTVAPVLETTLTKGVFNDIALASYVGANPILYVRADTSGDAYRHFDFQAQQVSAGDAYEWFEPQGSTPAAVGLMDIDKTLGAGIATVDFDVLLEIPASASGRRILTIGTTSDRLVDLYFSADNAIQLIGQNGGVESYTVTLTTVGSPGDIVLVNCSVAAGAGGASLTLNGGTPVTDTPSEALPSATAVYLGTNFGTGALDGMIVGIRDNASNLNCEFNKTDAVQAFIDNGYSA